MNSQNKTILIMEDEKPLIEVIKAKMEIEGLETVSARSVAQGLEYQKTGVKVSAIWLDHYLFGELDGLDFVKKIKEKDSVWRDLPVFVVSNTVSPEKIQEYKKLGIVKCYTKVDFRLDEIINDIKNFLKK